MANRRLRISYRSNAHAPLWLVADKSGCWNENGLDVDTSPQPVRERAVESLKSGHVDLISGNHHNLCLCGAYFFTRNPEGPIKKAEPLAPPFFTASC